MGMFATIMTELAAPAQDTERVMIVATHPKAHRTASGLGLNEGGQYKRGRTKGLSKGGLDPKRHALADAKGRPIRRFLSAGQTSACGRWCRRPLRRGLCWQARVMMRIGSATH